MSKKNEILERGDEEEGYEEWQYDLSTDAALDFLDEELFPLLDEFDYENEADGYVPGTAAFVLLIKIVQRLYEEGFTKEELIQMVDESGDMSLYETVH